MAITKYIPQQVPSEASPNLRAFLDDQIKRLAPLVNSAAQRDETETITGDWEFIGSLTIPEDSVVEHEAALTILESQITDGSLLARLAANETITGNWTFNGVIRIPTTADADLSSTTHGLQIGPDNVANLIMDNNEIIARNNGAISTLFLNNNGGTVKTGGKIAIPSGSEGTPTYTFFDDEDTGIWNIPNRVRFSAGGVLAYEVRNVDTLNRVPFRMLERATSDADIAGWGQLWVRNDTPNTLMFTDDSGNDFVVDLTPA